MSEGSNAVPTGILIVRAWLEGNPPRDLRARMTTSGGGEEQERSMAVAATVDDVCLAVRDWLNTFMESGERAVTRW